MTDTAARIADDLADHRAHLVAQRDTLDARIDALGDAIAAAHRHKDPAPPLVEVDADRFALWSAVIGAARTLVHNPDPDLELLGDLITAVGALEGAGG